MDGRPQIPAVDPDVLKPWTSDELRSWLEDFIGRSYQPKSRAGRYAETIGEMVPMVVGGEGLGVLRGAQAVSAALRELPATLAKHAIAPGIAVQALEEALPDSNIKAGAGESLSRGSSRTSCCARRSAIPRQTYHTTMKAYCASPLFVVRKQETFKKRAQNFADSFRCRPPGLSLVEQRVVNPIGRHNPE